MNLFKKNNINYVYKAQKQYSCIYKHLCAQLCSVGFLFRLYTGSSGA